MAKKELKKKSKVKLIDRLGPGFITGASDDDPSGVATYAQTGAMFGYGQLWTALWCFPFMVAIQEMCGRIGLVTRKGLAGVLRQQKWHFFLWTAISLLLLANTVNIGADLGAMASSAEMLTGIRFSIWLVFFTLLSVGLQIFVPYKKYAEILKFFAFTLLAYVVTLFLTDVDWRHLFLNLAIPTLPRTEEQVMNIVAVLGTTISPYLFFWQADEEVEDAVLRGDIAKNGKEIHPVTSHDIHTLKLDTGIGMAFSNIIMGSVIALSAATLGKYGFTQIESATQAAEALKPLAGEFAGLLFATGIIGIGLLALPILAGSVAYAICEGMGLHQGLSSSWGKAKSFYGIIALVTIAGLLMNLGPFSPFELLYYAAVLNGLLAPPIMVIILMISNDKKIMGTHRNKWLSNVLGITITLLMTAAAVALIMNIGRSAGML